ncbi:MAG: amidohydrolase family protein [Clostridia bacterium]|nr:amidohydrolase family protein [Clostridia bacterium]
MKIFTNAKIYTEDPKNPLAEAMAIEDNRILFVGSGETAAKYINSGDAEVMDLEGRVIIPGLIDGHTHPETVAGTFWHVTIPWTYDKDELIGHLKKVSKQYPKEKVPYLYVENYMTEVFGDAGPRKELLDKIVNDRPARIQDFSDHACWYNSIALDMLKDEDGEIRVMGPMGYCDFRKDETGEYTGHAIEAAPDCDEKIFEAVNWNPSSEFTEEMVAPFLDSLKARGIMCLMDGFTEGEEELRIFWEMDKAGRLGMFFEASVILEDTEDIDKVIATVHEWQRKYKTEHINCNVVKFFMDGVNDHGDCLSTEPFHNDPSGTNYGCANATEEELKKVLLKLNKEGIDIHIHSVCDGSIRMICNAVESAQHVLKSSGGYDNEDEWKIKVTMAHCELIHPDEIPRIRDLGIYIDSTPHWSGGYSDEGVQEYLGYERWCRMFDFSKAIAAGCRVGFSSDVFNYNEARRADPFLGMQIAMTRVDPDVPLDPDRYPGSVHPPYDGKLSAEQLLHGYTAVNAERMRLEDRMGSIEEGKLANFIIMEDDLFAYPAETMGNIKIKCIYFEGKESIINELR